MVADAIVQGIPLSFDIIIDGLDKKKMVNGKCLGRQLNYRMLITNKL
jgi:hypothetical protein